MQNSELQLIADSCTRKFRKIDLTDLGFINFSDFRKILVDVSSLGITEIDITKICQLIPRNPFGRILYAKFLQVLRQVRFKSLKNAIIESQGGLQSLLLQECKNYEILNRIPITQHDIESIVENTTTPKISRNNTKKNIVLTGLLQFKSLIEILQNSPNVNLGKLQVMVLMSDAEILKDGFVDYFKFIPLIANTIKLLLKPKNLLRRAEMIESKDLSCESLLKGLSSIEFEKQLRTLFISYDSDHSGGLDLNEFIRLLSSLELGMTVTEMTGLMVIADPNSIGVIEFDDFVKFLSLNLIHLEREKRVRKMQTSFQFRSRSATLVEDNNNNNNNNEYKNKNNANNSNNASQNNMVINSLEVQNIQNLLTRLFEFSDREKNGFLSFTEIQKILLSSYQKEVSYYEIEIMLSDIDVNIEGEINYRNCLTELAKTLSVRKNNFDLY